MIHAKGCGRRAVQTADTWTPSTLPGGRDTQLVLVRTLSGTYQVHYAIRVLEDKHPDMVDKAQWGGKYIPATGVTEEAYISVGVAARLPAPERLDPNRRLEQAEEDGMIPDPEQRQIDFYGGLEEARDRVHINALAAYKGDRSQDAYDWDGVADQWGQILDGIERRKLTPSERVWDTEVELALTERRAQNLRASLAHLTERAEG